MRLQPDLGFTLDEDIAMAWLKSLPDLAKSARRPVDLHIGDHRCGSETDFLSQRIAAKSTSRVHVLPDGSGAAGVVQVHGDPGSDARAIAACPHEFQLDPVIGVSGIGEKRVPVVVPLVRSSQRGVDILKSVSSQIAKSDPMSFLQMTEAPGSGDILKMACAVIPKHAIWNQCGEFGIAGANVEVQPSVVVIVGLNQIESAGLSDQTGLAGSLHEGGIPEIHEVTQRIMCSPGANHQIKIPGVIEILHDHAPCEIVQVQPKLPGDVRKTRQRVIGLPLGGRGLKARFTGTGDRSGLQPSSYFGSRPGPMAQAERVARRWR